MTKRTVTLLLIWLILALLPLFSSDFILHIGIMTLMYAYLSQCWNILSGYSGQFSFGHAAFFGIGAYISSAFLTKYSISPWFGMIAGAVVALLVGLFIGFLCFRAKLRGVYFGLATLAFAEILLQLVNNMPYFNKTLGILIPLEANPLMYQFSSRSIYYYVIFIMVTLITLLVYKISRSKLGYNLIAIRENEDAAQSLGVAAFKNKMMAMGISSALTALAGTFYAQYLLMIEPPIVFSPDVSVSILLPTILGGAGTVLGPVVGSFLVTPLGELMNGMFSSIPGLQFIFYGAVIILVILFLPQGIVGWIQDKIKVTRKKQNFSGGVLSDSQKKGDKYDDSNSKKFNQKI